MKAYTWMLIGGAIAMGGCDFSVTKDDSGDDGFSADDDSDADTDTDTDADSDADSDADTDADTDADANIDFFYLEWQGAFVDGEPSTAYMVGADGENEDMPHTFAGTFMDQTNYSASGGSPDYVCVVSADVSSAMSEFSHDDWEGYDGMLFQVDNSAVTWELDGGACDAVSFKLGISADGFMNEFAWGFGYGPMNDTEVEDSVADWVGADTYAASAEDGGWAGQVGIGWLFTDVTGEASLSANDVTFVWPLAADGMIADDAEVVVGAGDSATPVDGWYRASAMMGFGWSE